VFVLRYSINDIEDTAGLIEEAVTISRSKIKGVLNKWRFSVANEITSSLTSGPLRKRSGKLLASVNPHQNLTVVQTGFDSFIISFKNEIVVYAAALEYGALVKPKEKTFLTIPIRQREKGKPIPLTRYKKTFLTKSKRTSGNYIAWWRRKKNESPIPIFVLAKEAQLPETRWFELALERAIPSLYNIIGKNNAET
jgi:hypothetical protein